MGWLKRLSVGIGLASWIIAQQGACWAEQAEQKLERVTSQCGVCRPGYVCVVSGEIFYCKLRVTKRPTTRPTELPTNEPTEKTTPRPTPEPTRKPSKKLTKVPTNGPTARPTQLPTSDPTEKATPRPTSAPTEKRTREPSRSPSAQKTNAPSSDDQPEPSSLAPEETASSNLAVGVVASSGAAIALMVSCFVSFDPISAALLIDAIHGAATNSLMNLPNVPDNALRFALSFRWAMLTFIPLGNSYGQGSGRRVLEEQGMSENGLEKYARAIGMQPSFLLVSCVLAVFLFLAAFNLVLVLFFKEKVGFAARLSCATILFFLIFPVTLFSSFAFTLAISPQWDLTSGQKIAQFTLALLCFLTISVWFITCLIHTKGAAYKFSQSQKTSLKALVKDSRYEAAFFWAFRSFVLFIKALSLGSGTSSGLFQSIMLLVLACVYCLVVFRIRPYRFPFLNKLAVVVLAVSVLATIPSILFALSDSSLTEEQLSSWGVANITLQILSLLGMLLIIIANLHAKRAEKQKSKADKPESKQVPVVSFGSPDIPFAQVIAEHGRAQVVAQHDSYQNPSNASIELVELSLTDLSQFAVEQRQQKHQHTRHPTTQALVQL